MMAGRNHQKSPFLLTIVSMLTAPKKDETVTGRNPENLDHGVQSMRNTLRRRPTRTSMAVIAFVGALGMVMPVSAGPLEDGKALLEKKDFANAARTFADGFDKGDGEAGFHLARMVELGVGFTPDPVKARALYIAAAERGSAAAMNRLGLMHLRGENVRQDFAAASELICKAADLGNMEAQFNCAGLALDGLGRAKDPAIAFGYYQKASQSGHTGGRNMEAALLRTGTGTEQDAAKAVKLFEQGASLGNPVSLYGFAEMLEKGEGAAADPVRAHLYYNLANERGHPGARAALERLTANMTSAEIEDAQARARNWKPAQAAEAN
ncbi:tetratricopeptide repeat protein [Agrobacterium rhizogenes]|uniref:tetratricopeptide repeat protein n=1 Tax=Rhizobium rhizogenes TaxID=359 RepID=UPI0022B6621B|nr:tetratricopeptide repeat protein [Rhizobium rhizogenes]MCZ7447866.1 tetratricopeptide repeat protein [Rhizobium rhizogenes]